MESTNLLQTFWGLSSNEEEERIGAAKDLLVLLDQHQSSTHEGVCPELKYAVQRLVKGLASNRKGARHGFYTALAQILVQFPQLSVKAFLKLVHTHLEPSSSAKSAEERGTCFGKGFALMALATSGALATEDEFVGVAKQLVGLVKRKSFLGEFCGAVMCELVSACPQDLCKAGLLTALDVEGGWEQSTPEKLQVLFHLSKLYCKEKWFVQFLRDHWNTKHLSSHKNFDLMKPSLMASSSALPRLHGVWPLVLEAVRGRGHFKQWWLTVVDDGLVMSSHERKYLSFQLLACVLPNLCPEEVGVVLSPNLLACLVNNSRSSGNYLHSTAKHLLGELSSCVKTIDNQSLLTSLFLHLQRRTNSKFDQLTKSKVVELIISRISLDGVVLLLNTFQQLLAGTPMPGTLGEERCEEQLWALEQVVGVVRNTHLCRAGSWLTSAATLLLGHAFFTLSSSCTSELPAPLTPTLHSTELSVQRSCQLRFFSVLTDLSNLSLLRTDKEGVACGRGTGKEGVARGRARLPAGVMENGQCFVSAIFQVAEQLVAMGSDEGVELIQPFSSEEQEAWDLSCSAVQTLRSGSEVADKAFLLLYSVASLGLLPSEERDMYRQTIMELEACRSELASVHKTRTPAKKRKCQESKWMQVLTDMLLGFLSRPSQLWRNTVEQVFRLLTNHVSSECLQLILAVLKPKQAVEDVMEEGMEEDRDSGDDGDDTDGDDSGDDAGDDSDDGDDDGDGDSGEEGVMDPAFADEVRRALGAAAAVGSDEESEASLDDDAMLAVDNALGEVFRTRFALKHQKKLKKDDDKSLLHFKLRVLDLVELFLQKEPSNPLIFDLVMPLYELIQAAQTTRSHAPLVERAGGIFRNRLCHAKVYPKVGLDWSALHDQFHHLVLCLYKANATTSPLVTAGCMFLIRVLRGGVVPPHVSPLTTRAGRKRKVDKCEKGEESGNGRLDVSLITDWLSDALHDFITVKNSSVPPSFFTTYIQRYPELAGLLTPTLVQDLPTAANHFKRTRVCEMMAVLWSGEGVADGDVWAGLSEEDAAAIHAVMDKGTKRKRAKRK